jgi:hypothetical protein
MAHLGARRADDPGRIGRLACDLAVIQRRQQLALGKVPGAAEDDIVEGSTGMIWLMHGILSVNGGFLII